MNVSRRALGLGLLGVGVAATGGYALLSDRPELQGLLGEETRFFGFVGGEKSAFLADPPVVRALQGYGVGLDARTAGSVEMVREPALISQNPSFLWPSSSIMVDIARENGVTIKRDQVVFNSPIVVYSWQPIVDALITAGLVVRTAAGHHELDLKRLLDAVLAGEDWSALGVKQLFGDARLTSTDPNRSNSGFMFAGLVLNLFAGEVAGADALGAHGAATQTIFRRMGFKSYSSGKLFEQYLAGGPGGEPMMVGYENRLVKWVRPDPARGKRMEPGPQARPVMLYPKPTVFSAHPFIVVDEAATRVLEALMSEDLQQIAWTRHGFRGPVGSVIGEADAALAALLPPEIDAVLPLPDAATMLKLLQSLA